MGIDMIEHETQNTGMDGLAARAELTLVTVNLDRTFLVKRMEIGVGIHGGVEVVGAGVGVGLGELVFFHDDGLAADAEAALNATDQDKETHNDIIWARHFNWAPDDIDDASGWALRGIHQSFKTSKSFPKGYPMDKNDTYTWRVINVHPSAAMPNPAAENSQIVLHVRYWGVYL